MDFGNPRKGSWTTWISEPGSEFVIGLIVAKAREGTARFLYEMVKRAVAPREQRDAVVQTNPVLREKWLKGCGFERST